MSIRRRIALSYLALLLLFAATLGVYLWSSRLRAKSIDTLDRALKRQVTLASIRQELDNLHKQVTLLSEMDFETGQAANTPEAHQLFDQKLAVVTDLLTQLRGLAEPPDRELTEEVQQVYADTAKSWRQFYEYLGVEQTWAVANVARAEPLSLRLQKELVPELQRREQEHVRAAQAEFQKIAQLTDGLSVFSFALSSLIAVVVAVLVSRHLSRGFAVLKHGTDVIGSMNLEYRIELPTRDELGDFATSFNVMAEKLLRARNQLTEANVELERRAQEIAWRQQRELEMAAAIQQGLMQVRIPDLPFAKIRGKNISCTQIGGDFFDVVYADEGLAVIITDVSGKGISAAIMASVLQGMIRADLAARVPLEEVVESANRFFCSREVGGKYATVTIVRVRASGEVEYVNCGHVPPVVIRGDGVSRLEQSNLPVGLIAEARFEAATLKLEPGDRIVLVTDGVTEAANAQDELFGDERLERAAACQLPYDAIFAALHEFCADTPLSDDCTVVEISFTGAAESARAASAGAAVLQATAST